MNNNLKKLINLLLIKKQTISTMESCTGGSLAGAITNVEGASNIFKYGAVTYSNEYKIKMGVSEDIINKYSVYSIETAREMSKQISSFTNSTFGIGVTGKLNREDPNNNFGSNNIVFISIYNKHENKFYDYNYIVYEKTRTKNKNLIIKFIIDKLLEIIK